MSFAISDEEKAAGKCLICQSKPLSSTLVIRTDNPVAGAEDTPPAPLEATARVLAAEPLTPSIRRLVLALPPEVRFRYRAGMHVELRTPGVANARTYSIANAPDRDGLAPDGLLEFFIARHEHGRASGWLHDPGAARRPARHPRTLRQLPSAQGPGRAASVPRRRLRPGTAAGDPPPGARHRLRAAGPADPLGALTEARLFALDALHTLTRRHPDFTYLVTLTPETEVDPATGWRQGRIGAWLGQEFFDLSGHGVLVAGPPDFVDAAVAKVRELGARPERILTDSFTPTAW